MLNEFIVNSLKKASGEKYYPYLDSFWSKGKLTYFLVKSSGMKYLAIAGRTVDINNAGFKDKAGEDIGQEDKSKIIRLYNRSEENLKKLTSIFPLLKPSPLGLETSFGFGDRLGLATPAHIRVVNKYGNVLPVFAQQSVRELEKTNRTFKDVVDTASWDVFQGGYKGKWGADADHVKEKKYFARAADAGMTMFTLDTAEVLEEQVLGMEAGLIKNKFDLDPGYLSKMKDKYMGKSHKASDYILKFDEEIIVRIAITYGKALDFAEEIFRFLKGKINSFDYELSFDETNTVTSPEAHYFIASEMQDRRVAFSSLALRFPGIFEKGIDYEGNISEFEKSIKIHSEISRNIGGYKLSLHSGSDKFSVYPAFNKYTEGIFHIKTSGTSWLEAVRVISVCSPDLFRKIFQIAIETFNENKKAYHINLGYSDILKNIDNIDDNKLCDLLSDRNMRRVFHIAYGAVLKRKKKEFFKVLSDNEEKHYKFVENHLEKHFDALNR